MTNAKFEAILDADQLCRTEHSLAVMGSDHATRGRGARHLVEARAKFTALLDGLDVSEYAEFTAYRRAALAPVNKIGEQK